MGRGRVAGVLAMVAMLVVLGIAVHLGASANSRQGATGGGAVTPGATPTYYPAGGGPVAAALAGLRQPRSLHVVFHGANASGTLSFDAVTDGAGDLSGTYSLAGHPASIVVVGPTLYMRGAAAISTYTGVPVDPSQNGWERLPPWQRPGILATVATPTELHDCAAELSSTTTGYVQEPGRIQDGAGVEVFEADPPQPGASWTFAVGGAATPSPWLAGWQYLTDSTVAQPEPCNGGATAVPGPVAGTAGTFTFALTAPPRITPPPDAADLPLPYNDPEFPTPSATAAPTP